ncbi:hypothetical protein [Streptomyces sp. NPDC054887]
MTPAGTPHGHATRHPRPPGGQDAGSRPGVAPGPRRTVPPVPRTENFRTEEHPS